MPKVQERVRSFEFFKRLILVEISAILTALSMPGMLFSMLAWVGLVAFFLAVTGLNWWKSALYGWAFGISLLAVGMYWLVNTLTTNISAFDGFPPWLGVIAFILFLIIEGAWWAIFGLLYSFISKAHSPRFLKALSIASLYVLVEYFRGIGALGFTGMRLSNPFYTQTGFVQLSALTGTLGIVFVVVLANYAFYAFINEKKPIFLVFGISLVLTASVSVFFVPKPTLKDPFHVGVVQPNVTVAQRYSMSDDEILSQVESSIRALKGKANLVFFPEGTFEYVMNHRLSERITNTLKSYDMSAIIGFPSFSNSKIYNSVGLFTPSGLKDVYSKHILVPFTEALPYPQFFGMFKFLKLANFFTPGKKYTVFDWNDRKFAVQICFESYFGWLSRKFTDEGATFLVTVTNDSWFSQKTALDQHFAQSVFRAAENRKWTIQVADTGITGVVGPYGRIRKKLKIHEKKDAVFIVGTNGVKTFYDQFGDWFVWIALAFVVLDLAYFLKKFCS